MGSSCQASFVPLWLRSLISLYPDPYSVPCGIPYAIPTLAVRIRRLESDCAKLSFDEYHQ